MGFRRAKARVQALGAGLADLAAAELAALQTELRASMRHAGTGGVLVLLATVLLSIAIAAFALAGFEALTLMLPRWAAALAIAGGLTLVGLIVLFIGHRILRRVESPVRTLRRHAEDHRDWWRARIGIDNDPQLGDDELDR